MVGGGGVLCCLVYCLFVVVLPVCASVRRCVTSNPVTWCAAAGDHTQGHRLLAPCYRTSVQDECHARM